MEPALIRSNPALDVESIRFGGERTYSEALTAATPRFGRMGQVDGAKIRRLLMANSLLLSEGMAPAVYAAARHCAEALGVGVPIEIYQAAGAENAAMHLCREPVLLEIQGRLLSHLDEKTLQAVMGHELGHYLAHGEDQPFADAAVKANRLLSTESGQDEWLDLARRLSMSRELTADRFGLLACRDLDSNLRLEMVLVTGLSSEELQWDTTAYLEQSKTLIEGLLDRGETSFGYTHPEHSLRAYALWLFSESDVYKSITGLGPGTRKLSEIDERLMLVLGQSGVSFANPCVFEEPLADLQECALSACVMVAYSDGEFHDSEREVIERVFAQVLPHWQDLLDPTEALSRFQELAPVLYASGPRAQRALFTLLTHVVAADGECKPEEIEEILAIGDALGCPELFRSLLPSIVAISGLSLDVIEDAPVRSIPMPAEAQQVQAALKVFFDRVRKRGGDTVTARRLLLLSGAAKNSNAVRDELRVAAEREGLTIEPALGESLDVVHRLSPIATPASAPSRQESAFEVVDPTGVEGRRRRRRRRC